MSDLILEPGRPQSGGFHIEVKPIPLDTVLLQPGLTAIEGGQNIENLQGKGELSSESPSIDQISEELQEALKQWTEGSLKKLVMEVQEHLTETLLSWEPDSKKSGEENLTEIRETVRQHNEVLTSKGGALRITRPMEEALLEALAKWLEQIAAQLLRLLGSAESSDGVEQLLEKLFRQITGTSPSRGRVAAQATAILQRAIGRGQFSSGRLQISEEGVLYRKGEKGARLDPSYTGQALRAMKRESRPIELERKLNPELDLKAQNLKPGMASPRLSSVSPELDVVRELRFAENFAKNLSTQPMLPSAKELPYISEERLGLELGLLWLKGEAAAQEPGITSHTATLIRQATEQRAENFFYEAGYAFQLAARAYPPGLCPNLWREDVFRVREELIRRYRLKKDPQRSLLETIAYTIELFQKKQEKEEYRTWLRYLPGRGIFLDQPGWEDIKQGWQGICRSWERFLQDMGIRNTPSFREAVGLQSLWAMILPPRKKSEGGNVSFWTLAGWLGTAVAAAAVACAVWSAASTLIRIAAIIAACFFSGTAFLLFRKSREK